MHWLSLLLWPHSADISGAVINYYCYELVLHIPIMLLTMGTGIWVMIWINLIELNLVSTQKQIFSHCDFVHCCPKIRIIAYQCRQQADHAWLLFGHKNMIRDINHYRLSIVLKWWSWWVRLMSWNKYFLLVLSTTITGTMGEILLLSLHWLSLSVTPLHQYTNQQGRAAL